MNDPRKKVISVVGPTASGKTSLSIALAQHFDGEVISADSRQVYRGLDICSAKVTTEEMAGIPHHLIDVADPMDTYTSHDFKRDADVALTDIINRHKLPIVAGGTFFYLDVLMGKMQNAPVPPNPTLRNILEQKSPDELFAELSEKDPIRAANIDKDNPRRLVRALEIIEALGVVPIHNPSELKYKWLTLGIDIPTDILNERIHQRILDRLEIGMIEEVEALHQNGMSWDKMESIGLEYRYISRYLKKELTREQMITELTNKTRQFAKRQRVWLKRDPSIVWLPFPVNSAEAIEIAGEFLQS